MKNHVKKICTLLVCLCVALMLAACSSNDSYSGSSDSTDDRPSSSESASGGERSSDAGSLSRSLTGDILEDVVGRWYRYGNLNDEYLVIWPDMAWEYNRRTDGIMDLYAEGDEISIDDSRERTVELPDNMSNSIYLVELSEDGILEFMLEPFFPEDVSIYMPEYDGQWHLDGNELYSYFLFDNGEWKFHEGTGDGGFGYTSYGGHGYLASDGIMTDGFPDLLAYYSSYDEEIRGRMFFDGTDSFELNGETYIRMIEGGSESGSGWSWDDDEDDDSRDDEAFAITFDEWYYFNGVSEPSFNFDAYGEVMCDYENGTSLNMPYRIEGDLITIGEDDAILYWLIIVDEHTLEDALSGDIFALLGTW